MKPKENSLALAKALLQLAGEDRCGFRPLTGLTAATTFISCWSAATWPTGPGLASRSAASIENPTGPCRSLAIACARAGRSRCAGASQSNCCALVGRSAMPKTSRSRMNVSYVAVTVICRDPRLDGRDGHDNRDFRSGPMLAAPARRPRSPRGAKLRLRAGPSRRAYSACETIDSTTRRWNRPARRSSNAATRGCETLSF
jgi:hypothetical protein